MMSVVFAYKLAAYPRYKNRAFLASPVIHQTSTVVNSFKHETSHWSRAVTLTLHSN